MNKLHYAKGYKNQVKEQDFTIQTEICPELDIICDFYSLFSSGLLMANVGYAWDGSSGPTLDGKKDKMASLVHDILYQLIKSERLGWEHKDAADRLYRALCVSAGMSRFRAWIRYTALRKVGRRFVKLFGNKHRTRCVWRYRRSI